MKNNSDFMVKKELVSAAELKKELELAKAELVLQKKKAEAKKKE